MTMYQRILARAKAAAEAANFQAVADALNAKSISKPAGKVQLDVVLSTLGADAESVFAAFGSTAVGLDGRVKLATEGLDFANPLTVAWIDGLQAAAEISADNAAKLKGLGIRLLSEAEDAGIQTAVTAVQCEAWWRTGKLEALRTKWRRVSEQILALIGESSLATDAEVASKVAELLAQ